MVKIGDIIGGYRLVAELGGGGFATVYRGEHIFFEDKPAVAIKVLHPHLVSQEQQIQFIREAQLLKKLKHPYILSILDAGIHEQSFYLILEYAVNGSLRERIKSQGSKPFPVDEATKLLLQIGDALQYAHGQNVTHCDLKPENILFNANDDVLLADFGLAVVLTSGKTKEVGIGGTVHYMAPEQFEGIISPRSDQYALGCIAYELFTARRPFVVPYPRLEVMWYQHAKVQPIFPRQLNVDLPAHIEEAILKAMAKDRTDRHADVSKFIISLCTLPQKQVIVPEITRRPGASLWKGNVIGGRFHIQELLRHENDRKGNRSTIYTVTERENPSIPLYMMRHLWIQYDASDEDRKYALECFNKEVEFLQSSKHPHIPPTIFAFHENDNYYFVTELVPERTIEQMLKEHKGPLEEKQVIPWMIQICESLMYLHACKSPIILGEFQENDIIVTSEGDAKLVYFSSLRNISSGIWRKIRARGPKNAGRLPSIDYTPPEFEHNTDVRSDIYSLGAVMHRCLTLHGTTMFEMPTAGSILAMNPQLRTVEVNNKIVCPIEQVIIKAMRYDPNQRFQNANAMRNAVMQCLPK